MTKPLTANTPLVGEAVKPLGTTYKLAQPTRLLHSLRPHPDNPRGEVRKNNPKIIEMADSIIENGIIEPLVITPDGFVIAGHRRRVASFVAYEKTKDKKFLTVPVVIREVPEDKVLELMLHENMHRADLTLVEEARAMHRLMEQRKLTVAGLVRVVNMPVVQVSARLSILKLEPEVQALYAANEMPLSVAPLLSRVATREKQISYAGLIARHQITIAEFKKAVEKDLAEQPPPSAPTLGEGIEEVSKVAQKRDLGQPPSGQGRLVSGAKSGPHTGPRLASGDPGRPTRAEAVASVNKALGKKVSMIALRRVLEATCCSCGMSGQAEVCRTCPLPQFIMGLTGRAEGGSHAEAEPE